MGNFLSFKTQLLDEYQHSRVPLEYTEKKIIHRYLQIQHGQTSPRREVGGNRSIAASLLSASSSSPSLHSSSSTATTSTPTRCSWGYLITLPLFHRLFPTLTPVQAQERFSLWDTNKHGKIDLAEVVCTMILLADATFHAKLYSLFTFFDSRDSSTLNDREFLLLLQTTTRALERIYDGTKPGKELYQHEIEEVEKRAMLFLGENTRDGKGSGGSRRKSEKVTPPESTNDDDFSTGSHSIHHRHITFARFKLWCGVIPLISTSVCRENTTDAEEVKKYYAALLGNGTTAAASTTTNTNSIIITPAASTTSTLSTSKSSPSLTKSPSSTTLPPPSRDDRILAQRVHAAFRTWVPLHRQLLLSNGNIPPEEDDLALLPMFIKDASLTANGDSTSSSSSSLATSLTRNSSASSGLHTSTLNTHTTSSKAKGRGRKSAAITVLGGSGSGGGGGRAAVRGNAATVAGGEKDLHESKQQQLLSSPSTSTALSASTSDRDDLHRHRPAYLAIKRIQAKIQSKYNTQSRNSKDDAALQHLIYDRDILKMAQKVWKRIDTEEQGEIEIAALSTVNVESVIAAEMNGGGTVTSGTTSTITSSSLTSSSTNSTSPSSSSTATVSPQHALLTSSFLTAINAFRSYDVDQTGRIDFLEFLRAIFPLASLYQIRLMKIEVNAIDLTKKDIEILQKIFEWIDEDFDGLCEFNTFLTYLREKGNESSGGGGGGSSMRKDYARDYIPTVRSWSASSHHQQPPPDIGTQLLSFEQSLLELFSRSHAHMISKIKKWIQCFPVPPLTDQQHVELEQLFVLYDSDGSGSIEMDELVTHFTNLGFNEADNERMFRMLDRDGGGSVDLIEFKRFYRSVYDTTKSEDYELRPNANYYSVQQGSVLQIPPQYGVLINDTDVSGLALRAILAAAPLHGTAQMALTGAFIYSPDSSFSGVDTFSYILSNGKKSAVAPVWVTIQIVPLLTPSSTGTGNDTDSSSSSSGVTNSSSSSTGNTNSSSSSSTGEPIGGSSSSSSSSSTGGDDGVNSAIEISSLSFVQIVLVMILILVAHQ